jgi:hypothetical protein
LVENCYNYADSINAYRTKNVDGELETIASSSVGRIGGYKTTSYYSYSNNFSSAATTVNGSIVVDDVGSDTYQGANIEEEFPQGPDESEVIGYDDFISNKLYLDYISDWRLAADNYTILDINQDGTDELIINSVNENGFMYSVIFTRNSSGQITMIENMYHYGFIRYSQDFTAIEYSDLKPDYYTGNSGFYTLNGTELTLAFSVGWDKTVSEDYNFVYYPSSGETVTITADEKATYFSNLINLEYLQLAD